ncbi:MULTISPECIES: hypothetical protein [Acinetobacter]|uniref:DUF3301 domain-containing protein n=1 Tax=Acinetobacter soli NIPH 2899 TaxID=1217677 RepID=A0ABP2U5S3_9GAMM|nr:MULTISPECIES: hypothetical protein [Acinetobacter]ENV60166.1 hypothetical protein F950_02728 [Acinetobacter soli NIPH 2899]
MEKLLPVLIVFVIVLIVIAYTQRKGRKEKVFRDKFKRSNNSKPFRKHPSNATRSNDRFRSKGGNSVASLKEAIQREFGRFSIKERNGQILICEIDHRGEFNELIFVRFEVNCEKRVENKGRFIVASYPYVPNGAEMRRDFDPILRKYR